MKVVYIAGAYSQYEDDCGNLHNTEENIAVARAFAVKIWETEGLVAHCPHLNTAGFEKFCKCVYQDYINGDLEILSRCDALLLLPNWQYSGGTQIEKESAEELGIPIFYSLEEMEGWL